jgi:CRP-like cAMP-binding protein
MAHPLIQNLQQHELLSEADVRMLLGSLTREREYRPGDDLIRQGDQPWESTVLLEGFAARYKIQGDGRRRISSVHVSGDFVDLHSFLLRRMDHSVLALTRCKVIALPHDALQEITRANPHLTRVLWLSSVIDGAIHREWLTQMGMGEAVRRTAHLICELFVRLGKVGLAREDAFDLPLTQADVADMIGISHVHLNRVLSELRENGLAIWRGGTVLIGSWERLSSFAQFDPTYLNLVPTRR